MTLAWLLEQLDLSRAPALDFEAARLEQFRDELLDRLDSSPRDHRRDDPP